MGVPRLTAWTLHHMFIWVEGHLTLAVSAAQPFLQLVWHQPGQTITRGNLHCYLVRLECLCTSLQEAQWTEFISLHVYSLAC